MKKKILLFIIFISCFLFLDKIRADDCPVIDGGTGTIYKFDTMGGNNIDNINICNTCADALHIDEIELPTPTKEGYIFEGWYSDTNYTKRITSLVSGNIDYEEIADLNGCYNGDREATLYARWYKDTCTLFVSGGSRYKISFKNIRNLVIDDLDILVIYSQTPEVELPSPTLEYDEFLGWYLDESLTVQMTSLKDDWNKVSEYEIVEWNGECPNYGEKTLNLYAKWKSMDCIPSYGGTGTIFNFETNGGEEIENITICATCADAKEDWKNTSLPDAKKDGYKFLGWYADSDLTIKVESIRDKNINFYQKYLENGCSDGNSYATLYAKWEKIENVSADNVDVDNTLKNTEIFGIVFALVLIISGVVIYKYSLKSVKQNKN